MKKNLFLVVVLLVLVVSVNAQIRYESPIRFGIGAVVGIPMADATDFYNLAYGADILGEYRVTSSFALTLCGSYGSFTKKGGVTINNMKLVSALVGAKYYISDNIYGGLQAGVSLKASSGTGTTFILTPAIGYNLTRNIDLSLRYQSQVDSGYNYSFLGIRAGFTF